MGPLTSMSCERILVVDDDRTTAKIIELQLTKMGYIVVSIAKTGQEAIDKTHSFSPDLLLMDIRLDKKMDGIEAAGIIMQKYHVPVIYLTAHADENTLARALATHPLGYVNKPLRETDLLTTISLALTKIKAEDQLSEIQKDDAKQPWKIQITCNTEGKVTRIPQRSKEKMEHLGVEKIYQLLPDTHNDHIKACVSSKKPQLVYKEINREMLAWEYSHVADSNVVNVIISDKNFKNNLNEKESLHHANLLDTLDHLTAGIILFNEQLNIFYTNNSAIRLLKSGAGLKNNNGYINCYDPEITAKLKSMVIDQKDHLLAIDRGDGQKALNILVTSLKSFNTNFGKNLPTTILYAFETVDNYERIEEVIRSLYRLSPSEAKLVSQLFITPRLAVAAESLGITLNTARTHLKRIYNKTHVHRVSSLIHMIVTGPASVILHTDG